MLRYLGLQARACNKPDTQTCQT